MKILNLCFLMLLLAGCSKPKPKVDSHVVATATPMNPTDPFTVSCITTANATQVAHVLADGTPCEFKSSPSIVLPTEAEKVIHVRQCPKGYEDAQLNLTTPSGFFDSGRFVCVSEQFVSALERHREQP